MKLNKQLETKRHLIQANAIDLISNATNAVALT